MTTNNENMISNAKRAARRLARTRSETYQECLDIVAQNAGCAHWGAFLKNPINIRSQSAEESQDQGGESALINLTVYEPQPETTPPPPPPPAISRDVKTASGEGIILGLEGNRIVRSSRQSTVLCLGAPGSGKTVSVTLPTIATSEDSSQIIYDCKPELLKATLKLGARSKARIVTIDPIGNSTPAGIERLFFNPLHPDYVVDKDPWDHATTIAKILIPPREEEYFDARARKMFAAFTTYLMTFPERIPGDKVRIASLPGVLDWMNMIQTKGVETILTQAAADCLTHPHLDKARNVILSLFNTDTYERAGLFGTLGKGFLVVKNKEIREFLEPSNPDDGAALIKMLANKDRATSIFLTCQLSLVQVISPLHALAVELAANWRARQGPSARSLQIILEDAGNLPITPTISQFIHEGPASGISLLYVAQTLYLMTRQLKRYAPDLTGNPRFDAVIHMGFNGRTEEVKEISEMSSCPGITMEDLWPKDQHHFVAKADGIRHLATPRLFAPRD